MQVLPESRLTLAIYLINMDGAEDRMQLMNRETAAAGIVAERVPAVIGRNLSFPIPEFSELSYKLLHGRRMKHGEVGCYLSHVECARRFLASDADLCLILEDDVSFEPDFLETIDAAARNSDAWDILRLTTVSSGRKFPYLSLKNGRSLAIALTREKGSGAYMINRKAARWITGRLVPMRLAYDIAFDLEYLSGLKGAFVSPLVASQDNGFESQIQGNMNSHKLPRWRYLTVLPYRAYLEVSRVLARASLLLWQKFRMRGRSSLDLDLKSRP
ncbi:MAG: glycosyltransferase family 25 protein [Rhizobium sp.]|nr:glycosyltransferase family 25 protein [Rhizobium sp.]